MTEQAARFIHSELMAEHGGIPGPSQEGALEAALARPQHIYFYSPEPPPLERLAAAYGFAIVKSHCVPDGNKRLGLAIIDVFLQLNGHELTAREANAVLTMREVADGKLSEQELAGWVRENSAPLDSRGPFDW